MNTASDSILLRKEPEGGYTVTVPALARARVTLRGTIDEAVAMAREALEVYIESLKESVEKIPMMFIRRLIHLFQ